MPDPSPPPATGKPAATVAGEKGNSGTISADQVQAMIDQALARQAADFAGQVRQVAGGAPLPPHSAGPGTDVAETWSQYQQSQSQAKAELEANQPPGKP